MAFHDYFDINSKNLSPKISSYHFFQVKEYIDKNPITFFTANPAKDNRKFQIKVTGELSTNICFEYTLYYLTTTFTCFIRYNYINFRQDCNKACN